MKKIFFLFGFVAVFILTACDSKTKSSGDSEESDVIIPTTEEAIDHNDEIVGVQSEMIQLENDLVYAISEDGSVDAIETAYDDYLSFIKKNLNKYEDMDAFDESDTFRKALVDLLKAFKDVAKEEWRAVVDLLSKDPEEITDQDIEDYDVLLEDIDDKENKANEKFLKKQKKFADEYDFKLVSD